MNPRLLTTLFLLLLLAVGNLQADDFIARTYTGPDGKPFPYRLLIPQNYDKTQSYPVVIFFHGSGERGNDNISQVKNGVEIFDTPQSRSIYPCFVIVPQCPTDDSWVKMSWNTPTGIRPDMPSVAMLHVLKCLDAINSAYSTDRTRIYLTGISMGGFAVWDCITRFPAKFAAGVATCGGGDESTVTAAAAKVPIWAFHADNDPVVPVVRSRNMVAAMKKAGGNPHYTEYEKIGHVCWYKAFSEPNLLPWLFAQRLGVPDKSNPASNVLPHEQKPLD